MREPYTRILVSFLLFAAVTCGMTATAQNTDLPGPTPNLQKVPAGTYVIAMDNALQSNPGYFNLKAYGLVVKILNSKKAVCWSIRSGKLKDEVDFTAAASLAFPSVSAVATRNFKAGPFLVMPRDSSGVAAIINSFNNRLQPSERVNVYQLASEVVVDIRYVLTQIPRAAILNDGNNSSVHASYFALAAIDSVTNWRITAAINLDDSCYTFASEPHSDKTGPTIDSIRAYVLNGGNFLAQCRAVNTYENEINGRFHTNNGITIRNVNTSPNFRYPNPDLSFTQYDGRFDPMLIGGSERNWNPITGSVYINNTHRHQCGGTGADTNVVGQSVAKLSSGTGHLVFYTGGHDYAKSTTIDFINGLRSYFNAMLTPSGVTKCNFLRFDNDLAVTKTAPSSVCQGDTALFTIVVTNNGPTQTSTGSIVLREVFPDSGFSILSTSVTDGVFDQSTREWYISSLALNQYDTLWITAKANQAGSYENTVYIDQDLHDYDQTNDTAKVAVVISTLSLAAVAAPVSCFGSANGSAAVNVSSGIAPYAFQWSNGATTDSVTGLVSGNYAVTVRDSAGCEQTLSVTIQEPPPLQTQVGALSSPSCAGDSSGAVSLSVAGGTPPYSYLWSDSSTASGLSGLMAGNYSVLVTDSLGCTQSLVVNLTEPLLLSTTIDSVSNVRCNGESNGAIGLSVAGGTAPYQYQWSNGSTLEDPTGLTAGEYIVIVTDSLGCTSQIQQTVSQPNTLDPLITGTTMTVTGVSCYGGSDGSVLVSIQGGVPPYTYSWSNGATDSVVSGLSAGPLSVTILDMNGCSTAAALSVAQPDPLTPQLLSVSTFNGLFNVSCNGASDGSIDVTVNGGTPPYMYMWSHGDMTEDPSNLAAGSYDLTIVDSLGCSGQLTVVLAEPDPLLLTLSSPLYANGTNIACAGTSTGSVQSSVTGGTAPYIYAWNPTGGILDSLSQVPSGYYLLDVFDQNGCHTYDIIQLTEPDTLSLVLQSTPAACNGTPSGSVSVAAVNGSTGGLQYQWTGYPDTTATLQQLPIGSYQVVVTDALGCTAEGTASVSQPDVIALALNAPVLPNGYHLACQGDNDATINSAVQGGTPPYSYLWSPMTSSGTTVTGLSAGIYSLLVIDANGCQETQTITITEPQALGYMTSRFDPLCYGANNGSVAIDTVTGGSMPVSVTWSNGVSGSYSLQQLAAGSYGFTITDAAGCTAASQLTIVDPPLLVLTPDQVVDPACHGGTNGSAAVVVSGGTGLVSLTWSTGAPGSSITGLIAGSYQVIGVDANGCSSDLTVNLQDPPALTADAGSGLVVCDGDAVRLDAELQQGQSGIWTTNDPRLHFDDATSATALLSGISDEATTVQWTVSDANGCTATASLSIRSFAGLTAAVGSDTTFCGDLGLLLQGNLPDSTVGMWTSMNGAVFSDPYDPNAIVNIIQRGPDTLVWTIANDYCEKSAYLVVVSNDCGFDMPNGFSPNGDGKNDDFEVKGIYNYPDNYLRIFNRWGNLVYSHDDYTGHEWYGQNNEGNPLPEGTYFVLFVANGSDFRKGSYVDIRR